MSARRSRQRRDQRPHCRNAPATSSRFERSQAGYAGATTRSSSRHEPGEQAFERSVRTLLITVVLALVILVQACVSSGVWSSLFGAESSRPEASPASVVAEPKASEPVTINLVMIGDILQHRGVYQSGLQKDGSYNFDHIFEHVKGQLKGQDIKVVNQETPLGGADVGPYSGYPSFNGPQEMGDAEAKAGFNVILRASNHSLDKGYDGIHAELSFWKKKHPKVAVIGERDVEDGDTADDRAWYMYEKDGFKVALLNYTYGTNGIPDSKNAVNVLDKDAITSDVSKARAAGADLVIAFPHWGTEYQLKATDEQRAWAQVFMDAGVDVIIGGHPHVIEPVEVLTASDGRKVPCFWSVGNFVSTQNDNQNLVGGMAKVTMQKTADGKASVTRWSFVPVITHKGTGDAMTTYLLSDYTDKLAKTNIFQTDNSSLTPAWAEDFCTTVLGDRYDRKKSRLTGTLEDGTDVSSSSDASALGDSASNGNGASGNSSGNALTAGWQNDSLQLPAKGWDKAA